MPHIVAERLGQPVGRIQIPEKLAFNWFLTLPLTGRASITVPVRVRTRDRGWTRDYYADLNSLSPFQVSLLAVSGVLSPSPVAHAAQRAA